MEQREKGKQKLTKVRTSIPKMLNLPTRTVTPPAIFYAQRTPKTQDPGLYTLDSSVKEQRRRRRVFLSIGCEYHYRIPNRTRRVAPSAHRPHTMRQGFRQFTGGYCCYMQWQAPQEVPLPYSQLRYSGTKTVRVSPLHADISKTTDMERSLWKGSQEVMNGVAIEPTLGNLCSRQEVLGSVLLVNTKCNTAEYIYIYAFEP